MNVPVPVPLVVLSFAVVGFEVVAQHTPLAVTVPPPSEVTLPPDTAVVRVTEDMSVVVTEGMLASLVVNVSSFPYAVPALLVA